MLWVANTILFYINFWVYRATPVPIVTRHLELFDCSCGVQFMQILLVLDCRPVQGHLLVLVCLDPEVDS